VGIAPFSKELVETKFKVIEEPEDPIPIHLQGEKDAVPDFDTIGAFYRAIQQKIRELGDGIFEPAVSRQVLNGRWFTPDVLYAITNVTSAVSAIEIIIVEGEGTREVPYQSPHDLAHYYRFDEISVGHPILKTPNGYTYDRSVEIPFDAKGVHPLKPNCKIADFKPGSQAHTRIVQFNASYNRLLTTLHQSFNGEPRRLDAAIGLMYSLKMEAVALMQTPITGSEGLTVGPSYEYTGT
jgi:hypothetical protein